MVAAEQKSDEQTWEEVLQRGFLAEAAEDGDAPELYKAAIKFAALVRRSMSWSECRRASVELILEAEGIDS